MALQTRFVDIVDPEVIQAIVAEGWINNAKTLGTNIFTREALPIQGSLVHFVRERRFQDLSMQSVAAGDIVKTVGKSQALCAHPVINRMLGCDDPDSIMQYESKAAANETFSAQIEKTCNESLDASVISVIEGAGAYLTGNQAGTGVTVDLASMIDAFAALDEWGMKLKGGAIFGHSAVYYKLAKLGLVAATSNTFGNVNQDFMVRNGMLPETLVGMTYFATDKLAAYGSNQYYLYFVGPGAINLRGGGSPTVESMRDIANGRFSTVTLFSISYALGFHGLSWVPAGSDIVADTTLATSTSWTLADGDSKMVKLARLAVASV